MGKQRGRTGVGVQNSVLEKNTVSDTWSSATGAIYLLLLGVRYTGFWCYPKTFGGQNAAGIECLVSLKEYRNVKIY